MAISLMRGKWIPAMCGCGCEGPPIEMLEMEGSREAESRRKEDQEGEDGPSFSIWA